VYRRRAAARLAFTIAASSDSDTSSLPRSMFELPYGEMAAGLYVALLELLPRLIASPDDFRPLWAGEDAALTRSEELLDRGVVTIEERPAADLAVVRLPAAAAASSVECHPMAIHSRTERSRILLMRGRHVELQYRYEGWVQMASRRPMPRVDLAGLAEEFNREERGGGRWVFDGVEAITPKLRLQGRAASTIPADRIAERIERELTTAPPAWDPYD
jgi:hypothetical protein